jgi:F-type H+-transporting ATPase subunit epsilon
MILDILTPEAQIFHGPVDFVTMPGLEGEFQVLNGHAAIISALKAGTLRFKASQEVSENEYLTQDGKDSSIYHYPINGGVAEMLGDKVVVLAE